MQNLHRIIPGNFPLPFFFFPKQAIHLSDTARTEAVEAVKLVSRINQFNWSAQSHLNESSNRKKKKLSNPNFLNFEYCDTALI